MNKTHVSTTVLSKRLNVESRMLFDLLVDKKLVIKDKNDWELTDAGKKIGGIYQETKEGRRYIAWPSGLTLDVFESVSVSKYRTNLLIATKIGEHFSISAEKTNHILAELGWLKKGLKGWLVTEQGIKQGGVQGEAKSNGVPYVRWPESILQSRLLMDSVNHVKGDIVVSESNKNGAQNCVGFRDKFEAKHRATDGHFVRSKSEVIIDNWLYMAEIVHAYERKLPIEEDVYCDFYIPTGKVYIEFWGYENDEKYLERKKQKIALYKKYGFNLIELEEKDVQNLDDVLPRFLLKYGVLSY